MKIFLDTADIDEIRTVARWGVLDGVTTNPTLYSKVGGASYEDDPPGDLQDHPGTGLGRGRRRGRRGHDDARVGAFAKLAPNIVVKVPMSEEGLEAMSRFATRGSRRTAR